MKRVVREFVSVETSNPMTVELSHIYGLQYVVQSFGDKNITGTNIYFDFGLVIFVNEDYDALKEEIFGLIGIVPKKPEMPPTQVFAS